jgi:hypothetical protein
MIASQHLSRILGQVPYNMEPFGRNQRWSDSFVFLIVRSSWCDEFPWTMILVGALLMSPASATWGKGTDVER